MKFSKYLTEYALGEDMSTVLFGLILAGFSLCIIVSFAVCVSGLVPEADSAELKPVWQNSSANHPWTKADFESKQTAGIESKSF